MIVSTRHLHHPYPHLIDALHTVCSILLSNGATPTHP